MISTVKKMSLQWKNLVLSLLLLTGFLVFYTTSQQAGNQSLDTLSTTQGVTFPVLESADRAIFFTERLRDSFIAAASTKEVDELQTSDAITEDIRNLFKIMLEKDKAGGKEIQGLLELFNQWAASARTLSESIASGKRELGDALADVEEMKKQNADFQDKLKTFRKASYDKFIGSIAQADKITSQSLRTGTYIILAVLALLVGFFILAKNGVVKPIVSLARISHRVSEGEYPEVPPIWAHDELGMLNHNFGKMVRNIESNVAQITHQKEALEQSNKDIKMINEVVQELSSITSPDELRKRVGERLKDLTRGEDMLVVRKNLTGEYVIISCSFELDEHRKMAIEGGNFAYNGKKMVDFAMREGPEEDTVTPPTDILVYYPAGAPGLPESALNLAAACLKSGSVAVQNLGKLAMQAELETARAVQKALFPEKELEAPYCKTTSHYFSPGSVGGDWYGYVQREKDCVIIMADATGHGPSAALITAVARAAVSSVMSVETIQKERAQKLQDGSLAPKGTVELNAEDYMSHMNVLIAESGRGQVLMTGVAARILPEIKTIELCNAGHTPIFVYEPSKGKLKTLNNLNNRLGFDPSAKFVSKNFEYEPGSLLIIYTDGINEARDVSITEWGIKRLKASIEKHASLGKEELKKRLLEDLFAFAGPVPLHDDVTLVIAELH